MSLSKYEQETIILYNEEESTATICTHNKALRNRLAGFAQKSNDCVSKKENEGYAEYVVPKRWVKINMPKQLSEESRQKLSERAKNMMAKRKEKQND